MAKKDPTRSAKKWMNRVANSGEDYKAGIDAQDVSPTTLAAANKDAMRARTLEAIDDGSWEAGLRSVTLEDWKRAAKDKGAQRLVDGARQAESKMMEYQRKMRPEYDRIREQIRGMPNVTEADRKARMLANFELMSALKGKGKR